MKHWKDGIYSTRTTQGRWGVRPLWGSVVAGPAQVEFPGGQKRRLRMRGTKKASGSIQKKLRKNLTFLLEETHSILPEITGPTSRGLIFGDKMKRCLKEIEKVIQKREDRKWLKKRMTRGHLLARALAGSLSAAHEEEFDIVAVFKHPVYGSSSYIRRGNGQAAHLMGFQMHSHPQLRLLAWEGLAKNGYWFFSWDDKLECTGINPEPPKEWLISSLEKSSLKFENDGEKWSVGDSSNFLSLKFHNDIEVNISLDKLNENKDSFVKSIALSMSPPRLGGILDFELNYTPKGWPDDKEISDAAKSAMNEVVKKWLSLEINDSDLLGLIHGSFCAQLEDGLMVGKKWFDGSNRDGFFSELQGSEIELEAVEVILNHLEGGVRIDANENANWLASDVVQLEGNSAHMFLKATWGKYGMDILEEMFSLTGKDADTPYEQQLNKMKAFGGFLRNLDSKQSNVRMIKKFPWDSTTLPAPLDFADELIKISHSEGVGKTTSIARKSGVDSKSSMGWAWVSVHGKNEGEAWHYEQTVRDKGGDWVPALEELWKASSLVIEEGDVGPYVDAMKKLRRVTGIIEKLPKQ